MGMIFKFRALSDLDDSFVRDYELRYDSDLLEFHRLICRDLDFEEGEMAYFFTSGQGWEKQDEFTSLPIFDPEAEASTRPMEGALLGKLITRDRARLIYTFDVFSGRSLYLELAGTYKEEPDKDYPLVLFSAGPAPVQFDLDGFTDEGSIFDEALGEFGSFEGDDSYEDDF